MASTLAQQGGESASVGHANHAPPLALYVHIPWCVRKCPYCDFNSHHLRGELPAEEYVDALLDDLRLDLEEAPWQQRELASIFIGGGTPSLLAAREVGRLLERIAEHLTVSDHTEITLEANPATVERGAFADLRRAGVNRVSIGVQSFEEAHLRDLGRLHDGAQADQAIREALASFDRVNLDLMYALPNQEVSGCLGDLERAIAYGPEHLSHYELTIEPDTVFARYRPEGLPDEDRSGDMREASLARLDAAGYCAYEVSAYARSPEGRSRHNVNYWEFGDYLGIGAGAHGKRSASGPTDGAISAVFRTRKVRSPRTYLEAAGARLRVAHTEQIAASDLVGEFMLNALRLIGGFSEQLFEARTGLTSERIRPILESAAIDGLLRQNAPGHWQPTPFGRAFINDLQLRFLD